MFRRVVVQRYRVTEVSRGSGDRKTTRVHRYRISAVAKGCRVVQERTGIVVVQENMSPDIE
jgi:hypothetical protein